MRNLPAIRGYLPTTNELPIRALAPDPIPPVVPDTQQSKRVGAWIDSPGTPVRRVQPVAVDAAIMRRFQNYSPSYHTKIGIVTSQLVSVEMRDGVPYGYYAVALDNELLRQTETTVYQYVYHDGLIEEVRRYSSRMDPWE